MSLSSLTAFVDEPQTLGRTSFETQHTDEKIIFILRQHIATNIPWMLNAILATAIPILGIYFSDSIINIVNISQLTSLFSPPEKTLILATYFLVIFCYSLLHILKWFFTVLIVTNRRVLDIDFIPPFTRQSIQTQLEEIQDVRETQRGIWATLFNYGNIFVQTAGTTQNIFLTRAPKPNDVHNQIIQLMQHKKQHDRHNQ